MQKSQAANLELEQSIENIIADGGRAKYEDELLEQQDKLSQMNA